MTPKPSDKKYHALILAGGLGTRLWPKSRAARPKQFQNFGPEDKTLLQQTISRLSPIFPWERIWVIAKPKHENKVVDQVDGLMKDHILIEPEPKGTAAAIAWASAMIEHGFPDAVIGVFPTDHLIEDEDEFQNYILSGFKWADLRPHIVVFGIRPTRPETAYGYIESSGPADSSMGKECLKVRCFHEKPDEATAREYILRGNTFWNSGIFIYRAETMLKALSLFEHTIWKLLKDMIKAFGAKDHAERPQGASKDADNNKEIKRLYSLMPDESIDKCLIERLVPPCRLPATQPEPPAQSPVRACRDRVSPQGCGGEIGIVVIPAEFGWNDIGIWETFYAILEKDWARNALSGTTVAVECSDCLIVSDKGILTAALGVNGLAIIAVGDCVLVCPRDRLDEVMKVVNEIKKRGFLKYL